MGMPTYAECMGSCWRSITEMRKYEARLFPTLQTPSEKLDLKEFERWAMVSWAIWNARNKFFIERRQSQVKEILDGAVGFLDEYQKFMTAQRLLYMFFVLFSFLSF